uniref:PDZ domain-containing protein n=1 Tax=Timema genevievae TaxID=629358 RepID=A0A7R9K8H9_TIMGE|nr:unnamed protein product [Timema genevievae]
MSFAVKHAIKKDISGSYRLSSQMSGRPQPVAMPRHSISSTEEVISLDSDVPVRTGMEGSKSCSKKPIDGKTAGAEDSTFLRHLELEPLLEEGEGPPLPLKGGRTPFTTTRRLVRNPNVGGGFGFSIAWTQPPRVERVETGLPADQAGLLPGDYVIFVEKDNVVTLPEEEILQLIRSAGKTLALVGRSCGNEVTLEVYRRTTPNGLVGGSTLTTTGGGSGVVTAPPQPSTTTCSVTTASLDLSKRRLHLPQVTFSSECHSVVVSKWPRCLPSTNSVSLPPSRYNIHSTGQLPWQPTNHYTGLDPDH